MVMAIERTSSRTAGDPPKEIRDRELNSQNRHTELLALLRLLTREPPRDHDFKTCPICKRHGITTI